jgi:hypothetical protein
MNTKKKAKPKPKTQTPKARDLTAEKDAKGGGNTGAQRKETPLPVPPI